MYRLTEKIPGSNISSPENHAWISAKAHPNWSDISRPHPRVFVSFLSPLLWRVTSPASAQPTASPSITLGVFRDFSSKRGQFLACSAPKCSTLLSIFNGMILTCDLVWDPQGSACTNPDAECTEMILPKL